MQKRILIVSNLYPSKDSPFYGSFVKNFEDQLRQDSRVDYIKGIYIKGLHGSIIKKILSYFRFYIRIFFITLFRQYDLIYVHLISHSTLPLRLVSYIKKLPLIFNIHGEDLLTTTPLAEKLLRLSLPIVKKARYIVVPSNYFKKITEEKISDYPKDRILVSASGGVKDIFKRGTIKNKESNIRIGYVSRIDRGKGWETLINAVKQLEIENIKFTLIIVGGGPQVKELESQIETLELKNVKYVGPIAHDNLPEFYQTLDLFIFPTQLRESLGLVGLEAMACGVPVIGAKIGGLTDYIEDNSNGFFFTPGNANDLARQIIRYISLSQKRREEMILNAIETAAKYRDVVVSRQLFDKIL